jgi:gluconolactonase
MAGFDVMATGVGFTEGPVWTPDNRLFFTSISHSRIYERTVEGARPIIEVGGGPNGMAVGGDGALYITQNGGGFGTGQEVAKKVVPGIQAIEGGRVRYLASDLGAPNDLCFGPDGRVYFTDPRGWATPENTEPGRVYGLSLDGELELLVEGPRFTNGIAFGPDASELYVGATFEQRVLVYGMSDGRPKEPREFCRTEPGFPDGMCFDEAGNVYVAATMARAVQVFDRQGRRIGELECGENSMPTNCCFGGTDNRTLFVTDARNERVLAFELEVAGLPLFPFR